MNIILGVDVVDIARFARALERVPRLNERLFTAAERELPLASRAARFAAKEAVAKALGAPRGLRWQDVEIPHAGQQPKLELHRTVAKEASNRGVQNWQVSLTHDAGIAIAVVIGVTYTVGLDAGEDRKVYQELESQCRT